MKNHWHTKGKRLLRLLMIICCLFVCAPSIGAQNELRGEKIVVHYPDGMTGSAERVLKSYEPLRRACEVKLGFKYPRELKVFITRDHEKFSALIVRLGSTAPQPFVAAVAFPLTDVIVLKADAWRKAAPGEFDVTFQHEISHCLLGHLRRRNRGMVVPRWLDEGIAQWVSEGLFRGDGAALHSALRSGDWIPFNDLEKSFPKQEGASSLAYAQSESMVRFIAQFRDEDQKKGNIHGLLREMATGKSFQESLKIITGLSFAELEDRWSTNRKSVLPFPLKMFPEILFAGFIVVLCFMSYATYLVRRDRRLKEMDREEAAQVLQESAGFEESDPQISPEEHNPPPTISPRHDSGTE